MIHDFVDSIAATTGASVAILQLIDDKLLCLSNTDKTPDDNRSVSTFTSSKNSVYHAITGEKIFRNKAIVGNDGHLTAYAPLYNWDDKLAGTIYVDRPLLNAEIKDFISNVKIGRGFFYIYHRDGKIIEKKLIFGYHLQETKEPSTEGGTH